MTREAVGNADDGGWWGPLPDGAVESESSAATPAPALGAGPIVGIGALCDLRPLVADDGRTQRFRIVEFVTLQSGERVALDESRGFTLGWRSTDPSATDPLPGMTRDEISQMVLNAVLPDDDDSPDDHPWSWLVELAQGRGLVVTEEELRHLPYEVTLSDAVLDWLAPA